MNNESLKILRIVIAVAGGIIAFVLKIDVRLCFLIGGVLYFLATFIPEKTKNEFEPITKIQNTIITPPYSKAHIVYNEIREIEKLASEVIKIEVSGTEKTINFNSEHYLTLRNIFDTAIEKCPNDADLFYARASLHYLALQSEDGKIDRDACLKLNPGHFDALMNQNHFKSWDTLFHLPGWDETQKNIPALMAQHLEMDHLVQVVRDHLRLAVAVVVPAEKLNMAGSTKQRWELKWINTPYGNIAAHYLFFINGKFAEFFIPPISSSEPNINSNYWLLRRLANETYCFITICEGSQIVWNERFLFSESQEKLLKQMGNDLKKSEPETSLSASQMAANWYMENSDEKSLKY